MKGELMLLPKNLQTPATQLAYKNRVKSHFVPIVPGDSFPTKEPKKKKKKRGRLMQHGRPVHGHHHPPPPSGSDYWGPLNSGGRTNPLI
ncbi:MAG: hypothetical protein JKY09_08150 [Crocinitomicaceae bacterium]|nr:hypothetical protein [Crocinitomicaceae bacterium]